MTSFQLESASRRDAKRIMRLLARRRSHWSDEPGLRQLSSLQIVILQEYIAAREKERHWIELTTLFFMLWATAFYVFMGNYGTAILLFLAEGLFFSAFLNAARQYRYAVYALTQTDDMRVLPTLIQATRHKWGWHPQVRAAILRLLQQVTKEHVGLLDDAAQKRLWQTVFELQVVTKDYDPEPALLTLHALNAIGNQATLVRMKRLVGGSKWLGMDQYILSTAQELIPVMEARLQRQQIPATLLRAAEIPTSQPETLLRAATANACEPTGQLLRASTGEVNEP